MYLNLQSPLTTETNSNDTHRSPSHLPPSESSLIDLGTLHSQTPILQHSNYGLPDPHRPHRQRRHRAPHLECATTLPIDTDHFADYALGTPNGYKASIVLEELKEAYGLDYTFQPIDIHKNVQKEPWFTAINPNGRVPAIVDHDNGDLAVFEGNAILSYLTRRYDTENRISFAITDDDYTRAESWVGWQHGGIGPMQGQAGHFLYAAKDGAPWGIYRYIGETQRLWGILDKALADRDYLVGPGRGRFSIADISLIGWVQAVPMIGIDIYKYPAIKAWLDRCLARPAVQRGITVPAPPFMSVDLIERRIAEGDEELKEKVEGLKKRVAEAFEKYEGK